MTGTRTRAAAKAALTAVPATTITSSPPIIRSSSKKSKSQNITTGPRASDTPGVKLSASLVPSSSIIVDSRAAVQAKVKTKTKARTKQESETIPESVSGSKSKRRKVEVEVTSKIEPQSQVDKTKSKPYTPSILPLTPTISLKEAITHLTSFDPRFGRLFESMPCRPFVEPYQAVDPFRTLASSIIGQQVSWMAARAINNRFRALFGYTDEESFPSPHEVVKKDVLVLKSAGLSLRKAEYVISLAEHFISGELSTELLRDGTDEEITKALIAVRGIGQWTVDMFLIFSLRRANILPYTDLGVQKGLLRFALTAHGAFPEKEKGKFVLGAKKASQAKKAKKDKDEKVVNDQVDMSGNGKLDTSTNDRMTPPPMASTSNLPPTPYTPNDTQPRRAVLHTPNQPGAFTAPSTIPLTPASPAPNSSTLEGIKPVETLEVEEKKLPPPAPDGLLEPMSDHPSWDPSRIAPLTNGLTVELMRSRWGGKKAKGGAYLTPEEMETLTEGWKPYRSLGVYYTWAIADGGTA